MDSPLDLSSAFFRIVLVYYESAGGCRRQMDSETGLSEDHEKEQEDQHHQNDDQQSLNSTRTVVPVEN